MHLERTTKTWYVRVGLSDRIGLYDVTHPVSLRFPGTAAWRMYAARVTSFGHWRCRSYRGTVNCSRSEQRAEARICAGPQARCRGYSAGQRGDSPAPTVKGDCAGESRGAGEEDR